MNISLLVLLRGEITVYFRNYMKPVNNVDYGQN
jgi:hypothetical protein